MTQTYTIEYLKYKDINRLQAFVEALKTVKNTDYFERQFKYVEEKLRTIVIAKFDKDDAGYAIFNKAPKYNLFRRLGIPEIQDLNVLPEFRRQGVGRAIITKGEQWALENGFDTMGIGVGLHSTFGAAQRLYIRMGYIPDGAGINYDRKPLNIGAIKPVDDDLCLMMTKSLTGYIA